MFPTGILIKLVNCGGDGSAESAEQKVAYDTEFSTLTYNSTGKKFYKDKDETELFSGTAGEKNSSDELVILAEIKNGYLVTKKKWTDFGGELILTCDMEYKDGENFNGWCNYILKDEYFTITNEYHEYKNGKENKENHWFVFYNEWDNMSYLIKGDNDNNKFCEVKGDFEYNQERRIFLFDCVKSQNLKNFHMYINE